MSEKYLSLSVFIYWFSTDRYEIPFFPLPLSLPLDLKKIVYSSCQTDSSKSNFSLRILKICFSMANSTGFCLRLDKPTQELSGVKL